MNNIIIDNLFEFWSYIGKQNNIYTETSDYKAVSVINSDWPKRIYAIEDKIENYEEIIKLSNQELLPNTITLHRQTDLINVNKIQLRFIQTNMCLDLKSYTNKITTNENIFQVVTKEDAFEFANIASKSFGYEVDNEIIFNICKKTNRIKIFIYKEENISYGCGIIFFDKSNVAGLHMIGTIPNGRGKGIGKSMTEKLIDEAIIGKSEYCVLNASKLGEPIYEKLGFKTFGLLENYIILK